MIEVRMHFNHGFVFQKILFYHSLECNLVTLDVRLPDVVEAASEGQGCVCPVFAQPGMTSD
jgi:hypothetical protein